MKKGNSMTVLKLNYMSLA